MSNLPKISLIIPVYNVSMYLKECLDSAINQTLKDIEIICIDDGSTDDSYKILKEYSEYDNRIKIITKPNSGYGHTMNIGLDMATGEYIGILESDDYIDLGMYQKLYSIAKSKDCDLVKADYEKFVDNHNKREFEYVSICNKKCYYNKVINAQKDLSVFNISMLTWAGIYKKDFIDKHKIRYNQTPGASYQDNGFWFQTLANAEKVYFLDESLYRLRRDNPNSSINSKAKVYCMCDEYDFIREYLSLNKDLENKYKCLCAKHRFYNYEFTLSRISDEFKLDFINRFAMDFNKIRQQGELNEKVFTKYQLNKINQIIDYPDVYYYRTYGYIIETMEYLVDDNCLKELEFIKLKLKATEYELDNIKNTVSYKVLNRIKFIINKIKGLVWCQQEHGFNYTMNRVVKSLKR